MKTHNKWLAAAFVCWMILGIIVFYLFISKSEHSVPELAAPASTVEESTAVPSIPPEETEAAEAAVQAETIANTEEETASTEPPYPTGPQLREDGTLFNPIPKYNQLDYPKVYYGDYSVATDGCGITCAAMVISYLRNEEVMPDMLARRFKDTYGSLIQRMEQACTLYGLVYHKTLDWDETIEALQEGKVVISLQNSNSLFTDKEHFIILNGISPDKKFFAIDPFGLNYGKFDLKDGFKTGFPEGHVWHGFAGGWIFEFYEPPQVGPTQYPGLTLTEEDTDLLTKFIWYYGRYSSHEEQQGLAELLLNRLVSDQYPSDSIKAVLTADKDFVKIKNLNKEARPAEIQHFLVKHALEGPHILQPDVYNFDIVKINTTTWNTINGIIFS